MCIRRINNKLTVHDHAVIVQLHFGALEDTGLIVHSVNMISKRLKLRYDTVRKIIERFKQRGIITKYIIKHPRKQIPQEVIEYLIDQSHLVQDQHLSLIQRCAKIKQLFHFSMCTWKLRITYIKLGIRYLKAGYQYKLNNNRLNTLEIERKAFAVKLATAIMQKKHLIYMDETSINSWYTQQRYWMNPDDPLRSVINSKRASATLIGAISQFLPESVYQICKSTVKDSVLHFLITLKNKCDELGLQPVLVDDNHRAHNSLAVKQYIEMNFESLRIPPYSCQFNSIETQWAALKKTISKIDKSIYETHEQMGEMIMTVATDYPISSTHNIVRANHKYIVRYLRD